MTLRFAVLVPARLESSRLPRKVLLAESGKPLVQHVAERAAAAPGSPRVIVCTDSEEVAEAVRAFGTEAHMTRADHRSGTDRCAEVAATLDESVVVNLQGDEPLIEPADLTALARAVAEGGADIATLGHPFADAAARANPNAVKALRGSDGYAVAFQRADPDAERLAALGHPEVLHHVGIYAFRRDRLLAFPTLEPTESERRERLEQLRALDHGWRIRVLDASREAFGVDTRADYDAFLASLAG
ncbi:MAG: 3-deoxy-manno-octulosonate cytidylyltransferase [Planctomycetota bacterium]|nr:3-deoxy-manno-octulosonate cytidylyltransferase [Planctomycetota bacterium]